MQISELTEKVDEDYTIFKLLEYTELDLGDDIKYIWNRVRDDDIREQFIENSDLKETTVDTYINKVVSFIKSEIRANGAKATSRRDNVETVTIETTIDGKKTEVTFPETICVSDVRKLSSKLTAMAADFDPSVDSHMDMVSAK